MSAFGERLKRARQHLQTQEGRVVSQGDLAKRVSSISRGRCTGQALSYLERVGQRSEFTRALAQVCGVNYEWLETGEPPMLGPVRPRTHQPKAPEKLEPRVLLEPNYLGGSSSENAKSPPPPSVPRWALALEEPLPHIRDLKLVKQFGDTMMPTIRHGDLILVDAGVHSVEETGIFVLLISGKRCLRRIIHHLDDKGDHYTVQYDNAALGEHDTLRDPRRLKVLGRVLLFANVQRLY